jgi:hypothetical protein
VVGIVLTVSIGGFLLAILGTQRPVAPAPPGSRLVAGTALHAVAAAPYLRSIATGGDPPADIVAALTVPAGMQVSGHRSDSGGVQLYDASISFNAPASAKQLLTFFELELARAGWKVSGPAATADGNGTEVLATRGSSDGYYWEVGVTVVASQASITPELAGASATVSSALTLRLFERDDAD